MYHALEGLQSTVTYVMTINKSFPRFSFLRPPTTYETPSALLNVDLIHTKTYILQFFLILIRHRCWPPSCSYLYCNTTYHATSGEPLYLSSWQSDSRLFQSPLLVNPTSRKLYSRLTGSRDWKDSLCRSSLLFFGLTCTIGVQSHAFLFSALELSYYSSVKNVDASKYHVAVSCIYLPWNWKSVSLDFCSIAVKRTFQCYHLLVVLLLLVLIIVTVLIGKQHRWHGEDQRINNEPSFKDWTIRDIPQLHYRIKFIEEWNQIRTNHIWQFHWMTCWTWDFHHIIVLILPQTQYVFSSNKKKRRYPNGNTIANNTNSNKQMNEQESDLATYSTKAK